MSGRRCKALRRAFRAAHGRAPEGVEVVGWGWWRKGHEKGADGVIGPLRKKLLGKGARHTVSEWRRIKRAYSRGHLVPAGGLS